ncbi:MAG TPA: hypothetical protein VE978_09705 [Chitinophagales bacterium]|nr:hypothetical protein [Chitinophagales bacterium]
MRKLATILLVLLLNSCNSGTIEKQSSNAPPDTFREFLKKFKIIDLPFVFRYADFKESFNYNKMTSIDANSSDTLFIKTEYSDGIKCFGMLPDTTIFFSIIYFYPADSYYPQLVTYNKRGKLIDETSLIVNGCGGDCGLQYCSETGMINKDLSIFCADTVNWEYFCDSLGQPIPNSDIVWINTKTGRLTNNGKVKMTNDKHQEVKKKTLTQ